MNFFAKTVIGDISLAITALDIVRDLLLKIEMLIFIEGIDLEGQSHEKFLNRRKDYINVCYLLFTH
jgi:hypothetical protein